MAALVIYSIVHHLISRLLIRLSKNKVEILRPGSFCKQLVWGLPPYYWVQVITKYLQSQHILGPPVYMGVVANAVNVLLNWLLAG